MYSLAGGSAQNRQPSGLMGEHTVPGSQPQVRFERMSNGGGLKPGGLVGAAQTVCTAVSVWVAVAVTVGPGSVRVTN